MEGNAVNGDDFILKYKNKLFEKVNGRTIVCFGAGQSYGSCNEVFYFDDQVAYIVDNSPEKQGRPFWGRVILAPDDLRRFEKGSFVVFITSGFVDEISRQLKDDFGLREGHDFFNLTEVFLLRHYSIFTATKVNQLLAFIDRLPQDCVTEIEPHGERIGIVVEMETAAARWIYAVVLYILMRKLGYRVVLVLHRSILLYDKMVYSGLEDDLRKFSGAVIDKLREKLPNVETIEIGRPEESGELDEFDRANLEKLATAVSVLKIAHRRPIWKNMDAMRSHVLKAYLAYYPPVDMVVKSDEVDALVVSTGLFCRGGLFTVAGQKYGKRIASYDGGRGSILLSSDRPCTQTFDAPRVVREGWFDEKEKADILPKAQKAFTRRIGASWDEKEWGGFYSMKAGSSFQPKRSAGDIPVFDIVIPINIIHDGAAQMVPGCFDNLKEWLLETLAFLIDKTDASILVRAHPAERLVNFAFISYEEDVKALGARDRILYARPDSSINTYEAIEKSRLVLPWTSTTGIEAILMGKRVILAQNCFYAGFNFLQTAQSKEQYFDMIFAALNSDGFSPGRLDDAYLLWYMLQNYRLNTDFYEVVVDLANEGYLHLTIDELLDMKGVRETIRVFGDSVPAPYVFYQSGLWEGGEATGWK